MMRALAQSITILTVLCWSAAAAERLDINRLYSLPWIIGTAPQDFVWSARGNAVAFLWNDEGTNFRDVWLATPGQPLPLRVTRMPRPKIPAQIENDLPKMQEAADAELDRGVTHVLWSPDQSRLLFFYKGELYAVRPGDKPELLTSKAHISSVKAAGSGNNIAFQSGPDLFIASVNSSGPVTKVTRVGDAPLNAEEMVWSHDGRTLSFISVDESQIPLRGIPDYLGAETALRMVRRAFPGEPSERRRVGFVKAGDENRIRWANLGGDASDLIFNMAWSPDNRTLLVDKSDLYTKERRFLLVHPETGNASLLLREADPQNVTDEWWADWAPDGRGIYFTSDRENFYQVYYASLEGAAIRRITNGLGEVFSADLNAVANALFYISNEGRPEERQLHKVDLRTSVDTQVTHLPGTHSVLVSPDGSMAADYFSSDITPPDLLFQHVEGAEAEQQVTHSPLPEFTRYRWVAAKYVTFPSTADGVTLHGRITLPPDFDPTKRYPAILGSVYSNTVRNQWGGRVAHPTWGLDQYLAQQGYVLLNVDIRGSLGYGKAFRQKLALDYGGIDVEDLYSGVKFLKTLHYVDMSRVGIWGSSYGGLLTTMSLFKKPGVYKAGVAGAPATSLFHAETGEMRTMMAPQDHRKEYTNASAFLKSGGLADHLMIIHGMRDEIVLFKDSISLEQRLILEGKDVQLVVLPDSPHSWDTGPTVQTRFAYNQLIAFFKRYLDEGPSEDTRIP